MIQSSSLRFLRPERVRLRPGIDLTAQRTVRATLLRLDVDRLLAPFRAEAGLPMNAEPYGGWESTGLDGHTAGHVLSAASLLAAGGDAEVSALVDALAGGLRECQLARATGYIGGVPRGEALWHELRADQINVGSFQLNARWVPLYNLHKTLAGLLDAAEYAKNATARATLIDLGGWWARTMSQLTDAVVEQILECEFGGMTEAFARLALYTGDPGYLHIARRFARRDLVQPLSDGRDELDGLHANTQIPVVVGLATIERAARVLAPELLLEIERYEGAAARTFFAAVARKRSVAIGGDSVREHFTTDFASTFVSREGPETCNTHNMVKLAAELHLLTADDNYLLWAENARANHLRSSQHPEHGGMVYFTSQRPAHYRVYSPEADGFWCCMGSGFEAQSRHAALAYGADGDEIRINALIASAASVDGTHLELSVDDTRDEDTVHVELSVTSGRPTTVALLVPEWTHGVTASQAQVTPEDPDGSLNVTMLRASAGERLRVEIAPGRSLIRLTLPRRLRFERPADGSDWAWIVDGPDVLARRIDDDALEYRGSGARKGHIAFGALRPLTTTPVLELSATNRATRLAGRRVRLPTADGRSVEVEPFAGIHDARYTVSWPVAVGDRTEAERQAELERIDAASLGLEARTRDAIDFGEQQPESDHELSATDDLIGIRGDERWRRTRGAIAAMLRDWSGTAATLRLSWLAGSEDAAVRVIVGQTAVWEEAMAGGYPDTVRDITLGPASGEVELPVRIESVGTITPRLREVRLLASASDR